MRRLADRAVAVVAVAAATVAVAAFASVVAATSSGMPHRRVAVDDHQRRLRALDDAQGARQNGDGDVVSLPSWKSARSSANLASSAVCIATTRRGDRDAPRRRRRWRRDRRAPAAARRRSGRLRWCRSCPPPRSTTAAVAPRSRRTARGISGRLRRNSARRKRRIPALELRSRSATPPAGDPRARRWPTAAARAARSDRRSGAWW